MCNIIQNRSIAHYFLEEIRQFKLWGNTIVCTVIEDVVLWEYLVYEIPRQ